MFRKILINVRGHEDAPLDVLRQATAHISADSGHEWNITNKEINSEIRRGAKGYGEALTQVINVIVKEKTEYGSGNFTIDYNDVRMMMTYAVLRVIGPYRLKSGKTDMLAKHTTAIQQIAADVVKNLLKVVALSDKQQDKFIMSNEAEQLRRRIHVIEMQTMFRPYMDFQSGNPSTPVEGILDKMIQDPNGVFFDNRGLGINVESVLMQVLEGGIGSLAFQMLEAMNQLATGEFEDIRQCLIDDNKMEIAVFLTAISLKFPPIPFTMRTVEVDDFIVNGVPLAKGTQIIIHIENALRQLYGEMTLRDLMNQINNGSIPDRLTAFLRFDNSEMNLRACTGLPIALESQRIALKQLMKLARFVPTKELSGKDRERKNGSHHRIASTGINRAFPMVLGEG